MRELEEVCGGCRMYGGGEGVGVVGDMQGMEVCAWGRAWGVHGVWGVPMECVGEGVGMFPICVVTMAFGP